MNAPLSQAQDVKDFLWATYDPNDEPIYPTISDWDNLLAETIQLDSYATLTGEVLLSILFGLLHRNRIVEGLWWSMFEHGVTQKLLMRLKALDANMFGFNAAWVRVHKHNYCGAAALPL